jgi:hypothetical protein
VRGCAADPGCSSVVGLYWLRQRPESRFGLLLIAFGFVGAVYTVQSSGNHVLFGAGVVWEIAIYLRRRAGARGTGQGVRGRRRTSCEPDVPSETGYGPVTP